MSLLRRRAEPVVPSNRWAQDVAEYEGNNLKQQYVSGVRLLEEGQAEHEIAERQARRHRTVAATASIVTTVLAAAAGITAIPASAGKWVGAALAFCAAVVSGLVGTFGPARRATSAATRMQQWLESRDEVTRYLRWIGGPMGASVSIAAAEDQLARLQARANSIRTQAVTDLPTLPAPAPPSRSQGDPGGSSPGSMAA
jgi:hypothetical protein